MPSCLKYRILSLLSDTEMCTPCTLGVKFLYRGCALTGFDSTLDQGVHSNVKLKEQAQNKSINGDFQTSVSVQV